MAASYPSIYQSFNMLIADLQLQAARANFPDLDAAIEVLKTGVKEGAIAANCNKCRMAMETCTSAIVDMLQVKIIADPNVSTRNPDLATKITSLRRYFGDKKDETGTTIVTHANLIRHLGNTGSHAGNYNFTEFDSLAAISSAARVIQYTLNLFKRKAAGSSLRSPPVEQAEPSRNDFPALRAAPSAAASRPMAAPAINQPYPPSVSHAEAAMQLQAILEPGMLPPGVYVPPMQQPGQHPGWFPPVNGVPPAMMPQYYAQSVPVAVPKQPASVAPAAGARSASSPPQAAPVLQSSPTEILMRSDAESYFPSSIRNAANPPRAPVGGSFSSLAANGVHADDDDDVPDGLLAPDEHKPKQNKPPAGKAALRSGPVGAENRPAGAPVKPKAGARLPQGPPREPGDPAPPSRPGRRRHRKGNWKATEAGLVAMQSQQQQHQQQQQAQQQEAEYDEQDAVDDANFALVDADLMVDADEPDSKYVVLSGLDKAIDPFSVFAQIMEHADACDSRSEIVSEKLVVYIEFSDSEQAGKCYEHFQWSKFGGESVCSCFFVKSFPERLP